MENFNNVPSTGKYGDSIAIINQNFQMTHQGMQMLKELVSPNPKYVTVEATSQTIDVHSVLPATGAKDTIYRVGKWDGAQYNVTCYTEYAWDGTQYVPLSTNSQIGEVFDISEYKAVGGTLATFADLGAALNDGNNVPVGIRKGGMSVKFVQSSDNKYVQFRLMKNRWSTTVSDWQGVDEEPKYESDNLIKSSGVYNSKLGIEAKMGDISISQETDGYEYNSTDFTQNTGGSFYFLHTNLKLQTLHGIRFYLTGATRWKVAYFEDYTNATFSNPTSILKEGESTSAGFIYVEIDRNLKNNQRVGVYVETASALKRSTERTFNFYGYIDANGYGAWSFNLPIQYYWTGDNISNRLDSCEDQINEILPQVAQSQKYGNNGFSNIQINASNISFGQSYELDGEQVVDVSLPRILPISNITGYSEVLSATTIPVNPNYYTIISIIEYNQHIQYVAYNNAASSAFYTKNILNNYKGGNIQELLLVKDSSVLEDYNRNTKPLEDVIKNKIVFNEGVFVTSNIPTYKISVGSSYDDNGEQVVDVTFPRMLVIDNFSGKNAVFNAGTTVKCPYEYGTICFVAKNTIEIKSYRSAGTSSNSTYDRNTFYSNNAGKSVVPVITIAYGKIINNILSTTTSLEKTKDIEPFIIPQKLYVTCNNNITTGRYGKSRNYASKIYIDHFFRGLSEHPNIHVKGGSNFIAVHSRLNGFLNYINSGTMNTTNNIDSINVSGTIEGDIEPKQFSFNVKSVLNTITKDAHVRLLCIGDSTTAGINADVNRGYDTAPRSYWAWVKALFVMDNQEKGEGYDFVSLGNSLDDGSTTSADWRNNTQFDIKFQGFDIENVKAFACGQSGTTTTSWLSPTLPGLSAYPNPFYDVNNNKFSLRYWVENYRTLIVNNDGSTTRCNSSNKGALAPENTETYNVCEPTHVVIQLGYNESYNQNGATRDTYLANLRTMIDTIHTEYPDVWVILSLPDAGGTYFPELYPSYSDNLINIYTYDFTKGEVKDWHDKFAYMNKDLMELEDIQEKTLYLPSYFISPLVAGCGYRESNELGYYSSGDEMCKYNVKWGSNPSQHPNNTCHANIGYELYSLIKWTIASEL